MLHNTLFMFVLLYDSRYSVEPAASIYRKKYNAVIRKVEKNRLSSTLFCIIAPLSQVRLNELYSACRFNAFNTDLTQFFQHFIVMCCLLSGAVACCRRQWLLVAAVRLCLLPKLYAAKTMIESRKQIRLLFSRALSPIISFSCIFLTHSRFSLLAINLLASVLL